MVQEHFQKERNDGQKIDHSRECSSLFKTTGKCPLKTGLLDATIHAHAIFKREYRHGNHVQNDELQMQNIADALHRFEHHRDHRNDHPERDEQVKNGV